MSKRAKDAALKAWPKRKDGRLRHYACTDDDVRRLYAKGYRNAEQDLALTWEDVAILITIYEQEVEAGNICRYEDEGVPSLQEASEIILRRFNEIRKK